MSYIPHWPASEDRRYVLLTGETHKNGVAMEELLENCRRMCFGAFQERTRAYHSLRSSRAFAMVLHNLRGFHLTSYEVARLLADGGGDPLALAARRILEQQFDQQEQRSQAS